MDSVLTKSKQFEQLVISKDPIYNDMLAATEIVKDFIREHGLILYGGSGLDYALRLHGDKIYPDDMLPDLDFYSPDSIEHAYTLSDILYGHGYKDTRVVVATHTETMKVDLADNHWIADISYRPKDMFALIPYLEYDGMKIVHPNFQRIDMHSALAFPYDNAPREVIFDRLAKDVKRFNLLAKYYPLPEVGPTIQLKKITVPNYNHVLAGFAALAAMRAVVADMSTNTTNTPATTPTTFRVTKHTVEFDTLEGVCEYVHFNPIHACEEMGLDKVTSYEPCINLILPRVEAIGDYNGKVIKYCFNSTTNRLVGVNYAKISDVIIRFVCPQFLLKYFISMYYVHKEQPRTAATYLQGYIDVLSMIDNFPPSTNVYGNENINLAKEIMLNRLYTGLDGAEPIKIPMNYYPGRSLPAGRPHPAFDPDSVEYLRESGKIIVTATE